MKAVLLAGGLGTRISEETGVRPKPMVEIGGYPILWHIMKMYSAHGINDFLVCCGYKGSVIKQYFHDYALHSSDITFDFRANKLHHHMTSVEPWRVTLIDTGEATMTGGRLRRIRDHLGDEPFCMTYGDGVSDVDISALVRFHHSHGKLATLTAVQPPGRFGVFALPHDSVTIDSFTEKPQGDGAWINGGFFVLDPQVLDYVDGDDTVWEQAPMNRLAHEGELAAFRHSGFWQAMDTLRDKKVLCDLWESGRAPWRVWGDAKPPRLTGVEAGAGLIKLVG
ncbi:MAG: glucose-1-phosphate cytidylyltransferase [Caulobacteraceae bacterium]